ncbi:DUF2237 domain-containing protein [Colwellia sp. MB3u-70]|uniref:DUF2237 family protein n=1 Tax=unclassified Colwellia TaxID=196834 RepID=UPI0015F3B486|nr:MULTISPECIES: DUF2237 domain-containing protein [unclassified Colwellia]MBA6292718.1 DUF2237 domain-containing protein [Colwellia sp. MB3u-8]MBA6308810.1 DUF2237 domain-containing protein [Colwellia sp. MB3u-70]
MENQFNVLGTRLELCCSNTGFTRKGFCYVPENDFGNHSVCAVMTDEFLQFSKAQGNDLITPNHMYNFAGLKAGDKWCLCAVRWYQAITDKVAPPIILASTNQKALKVVSLEVLKAHEYAE